MASGRWGNAARLAVVSGAVVSSLVAGQDTSDCGEVRIVARKRDDGRVEFGLQQRQTDNSWGARQLPAPGSSPPPPSTTGSPARRPARRRICRAVLRRLRLLAAFVWAAHRRHHHLRIRGPRYSRRLF